MHADGKSTLASVSKWNSGKVNWLHFYLSESRVLAEAAGCKSCFALTLISQTRHIHMWRDMFMNYLSLNKANPS